MQSPKSQRAHAPGESPSSDDNPTAKSGGVHPERHNSEQARSREHVPSKSAYGHSEAGKGNKADYSPRPTHSETPSQAGRPGYQTCNPCGTQRGKR